MYRSRPLTAYGGVQAPPRNIKSIVNGHHLRSSAQENGTLMNILGDMTVIHKHGTVLSQYQPSDPNAEQIGEKFGAAFVNINKTAVLNNWIADEIVQFGRRQDENLRNLEMVSR